MINPLMNLLANCVCVSSGTMGFSIGVLKTMNLLAYREWVSGWTLGPSIGVLKTLFYPRRTG